MPVAGNFLASCSTLNRRQLPTFPCVPKYSSSSQVSRHLLRRTLIRAARLAARNLEKVAPAFASKPRGLCYRYKARGSDREPSPRQFCSTLSLC
jgi:hypothetical protein